MRTGAAVMAAMILTTGARAQGAQPEPAAPDGARLFLRQCQTCHTLHAAEPQREGPTLEGVFGRKAGSVAGFRYSPGLADAGWTWDDARLDAWLTNPQAVVPGAIMAYRQPKAEVRQAIIGYLKDLH